jgi:DnaJ-class molecular chaperone
MINYETFEKARNTLGLISLMSKDDVKDRYKKLSKERHPDMSEGSHEAFQELKEAYDVMMEYMQNYQFEFSQEEFVRQNPYAHFSTQWQKKL